MQAVPISVRDTSGVAGPRPVASGIPLREGEVRPETPLVLTNEAGRALPLQTRPLAHWRDGSIRWLLLDTIADLPAGAREDWHLRESTAADEPTPPMDVPEISLPSSAGLFDVFGVRVSLETMLGDGIRYEAVTESTEVECSGPVRRTLGLRGNLRSDDGRRAFQFRCRISTYAGLRRVRVEPLILLDCDAGIVQHLRFLHLVFQPREGSGEGVLGLPGGEERVLAAGTAGFVRQRDDRQIDVAGEALRPGKAPGWARLSGEAGTLAVALREFWQQWPKGFAMEANGRLLLELLPEFTAGDYDHMEPWYKYRYFFEGNGYRHRTGQARKWDLWIDADEDGADLARRADAPTVMACQPEYAIATGVWDAIPPAGSPAAASYDAWAENLYEAYLESIRVQRDYGAMNWGDWFGERQVNWGNHEYDTVNQLLIQFARTGDPKYFLTADAAARHSSEVDVIHALNDDLTAEFSRLWPRKGFPPRPGMVHEHCVGHVGSFYPVETIRRLFVEHGIGQNDHPYLCLDPFNLGHIWTQGLVRAYFLTGEPFLRETVECIGENLVRLVLEDGFDFGIEDPHFGRVAGWPLLALAGAYELDYDERYLEAMKSLVDRALERQDPHCGGWLYQLYPGHCFCTTRAHVGMAGFITSILINGLSRYGMLTGDERIPAAVARAVTFLDNDTWVDQRGGWRYTSCPASSFTGQAGVTMMAHVNAVRLTGDPEHIRVLRKAWETKFEALRQAPKPGPGQGKTYTATIYGCAETVGVLARVADTSEPASG